VPDAGLERCAGSLSLRPAPLSGEEGDWNPVIRDEGVQHADDADGNYEKDFRAKIHVLFRAALVSGAWRSKEMIAKKGLGRRSGPTFATLGQGASTVTSSSSYRMNL